jgi:HPt (histidine-containing phosphotransfer) domain-containing protein
MTDLVDATYVPPIAEPAPTGENDIAGAIDRLEGNTELYSQILQAFLTEVAAVPEQFGAIMARHDYAEAGRLLHTIKGLSLTVGANALSEVCRQGERTVKSAAIDGNESATAASTDLGHLLAHAITTTIDTLQAVQADLYRQPIATPVAAETLSAPALVQELETLQTLLRNSDMRALDIFAALDKQQGSALGSLLTPLQSAMIGFDFPQAVVQCDLLIQQFSQNNTL